MSATPLLDPSFTSFDPEPLLQGRYAKGIRKYSPEPAARTSDPGTSHAAAATMRVTGKAKSLRAEIYYYLAERGEHGATVDEISDAVSLKRGTRIDSISPRMAELEDRGLAFKSVFTRKGKRGNAKTVYIATTSYPQLESILEKNKHRKHGVIVKTYLLCTVEQKDEFLKWLQAFDADRVDRIILKGVQA